MRKSVLGEVIRQLIIAAAVVTIVGVPALGQEAQANAVAVETIAAASEEQSAAPPNATALGGADWGLPLIKAMGGFGLVLSLLLGGFYGARKIAPQYFNRSAAGRMLKVVETLQMGEKRSISVVEVGEKRFLVGNTTHQITLLAPLDASFSLLVGDEPSVAPKIPAAGAAGSFRNVLESEKSQLVRRPSGPRALPDEVRAKMQELRASLKV